MTKKFIYSTIISLLLLLSIGCRNIDNNSLEAHYDKNREVYVFRLVHEEIQNSVQGDYAFKFANLIKEKSKGKVIVEVYPVGQIGDALQQAELLQNGGIDFAITSPGSVGTLVPESNLFSLHFLFTDDMELNMKILKESEALNNLLNEKYLEKDIKVLSYWQEGFMQWTSNRLLDTPEVFKNLKIRTMQSPILLASYEAYGANPTPMPAMEVYSALQLKMIEAQENPIFAIEERKFAEVQDYLILSAPSLYVATTAVHPEFFDNLPVEYQTLILDVIDEMHKESYLIEQKYNNGALEKIVKANTGINIVTLNEAQRDAFRQQTGYAYDKYISMYGDSAKEILDILVQEVEDISADYYSNN